MKLMDVAQVQIPALRNTSNARAITIILILSAAVVAFLFYLLKFKPAAAFNAEFTQYLPLLNCILNGISASFLVAGFVAIRKRQISRHLTLMLCALVSSTLFLTSYIIYHASHGDTRFTGQGAIRPIYFLVLISHIVLSAVAVPLILTSLFLALSGRFVAHPRVSRYTFGIWLYVSVTGVLIFVLLRTFNRS